MEFARRIRDVFLTSLGCRILQALKSQLIHFQTFESCIRGEYSSNSWIRTRLVESYQPFALYMSSTPLWLTNRLPTGSSNATNHDRASAIVRIGVPARIPCVSNSAGTIQPSESVCDSVVSGVSYLDFRFRKPSSSHAIRSISMASSLRQPDSIKLSRAFVRRELSDPG